MKPTLLCRHKNVPIHELARITALLACLLPSALCSSSLPAHEPEAVPALYNRYADVPTPQLYRTGRQLLNDGRLDEAFVCFAIVGGRYSPAMDSDEKQLCAFALNNAGGISQMRSSYATAFSYYKRAMQVTDEPLYQSYNNIAGIYLFYNDYRHAQRYLEQAFDISLERHDWEALANALQNILFLYWRQERLDSIAPWVIRYRQAETIPHNSQYRYTNAVATGLMAQANARYDEAIDSFRSCCDGKAGDIHDREGSNNALLYLAAACMKKHDHAQAQRWLRQAEEETRAAGAVYMLMLVHQLQAESHRQAGNEQAEREARYLYMSLKDSVNTSGELEKIKNVEFFHEVDKYARQVDELNMQKNRRSQMVMVSIAALALTALLLTYAVVQNRHLQRSNKELYRKNEELVQQADTERQNRSDFIRKLKARQQEIDTLKARLGACQGSHANSCATPPHDGKRPQQATQTTDDTGRTTAPLTDEQRSNLIEKVYQQLDNTDFIAQHDLTVERLAQAIGVHERYVSQAINDTMHKNFNTLLNEYRIREACKRLTDYEHYGSVTNETIAEGLGYKSRSHFTRTFKKVTGLTPSQYQQLAKQSRKES